jgi:hypothetical protein
MPIKVASIAVMAVVLTVVVVAIVKFVEQWIEEQPIIARISFQLVFVGVVENGLVGDWLATNLDRFLQVNLSHLRIIHTCMIFGIASPDRLLRKMTSEQFFPINRVNMSQQTPAWAKLRVVIALGHPFDKLPPWSAVDQHGRVA